jgi:Protein of Unknown function (DUF2784)
VIASIAADAVLLAHGAFIAFVLLGAGLLWRWPRIVWLHLPAAAWGAYVEFSGKLCPLTPLENRLRHAAGEQGYSGGFVEHYLLPLIYPEGLTRETQWLLGAVVLLVNGLLYGLWLRRRRR